MYNEVAIVEPLATSAEHPELTLAVAVAMVESEQGVVEHTALIYVCIRKGD